MVAKVGVPVLGTVENMSMHICGHCGHLEAIFSAGGAEKLTEQYSARCLGNCRCTSSCVRTWSETSRRW